MDSCGIDSSKFFGESVSFGGTSVPPSGQPPPKVTIKENIEESGCSGGGSKSVSIDIQGELVCCDPDTTISTADSMVEAFSADCGDFSGGGYSFPGARVRSFDIASSTFVGNVPYSISLVWDDPNYGDGNITDKVDSVQSVQNDDTVTITHTVSARGGVSKEDCSSCGCEMSGVEDYVNSNISGDSAPSPQTFSLPSGGTGGDCPTVTEKRDEENCFFSITKVWTIQRNLKLNKSAYGDDIKVTKCTETSEDEFGRVTTTISGSVSFEGSVSCDVNCGDSASKVLSALESEKSAALASNSGRKANVSSSTTEGSSPSGNYTVTFPPEPDDASGADAKDAYCVSVSFGSDGVGTVSVNGTVTANQQKLKTMSENCLCEKAEGYFKGQGAAKGNAVKYYNMVRGKIAGALQKIQGPCFQQNQLGADPETEDEGECEGGSISYSYSWTDKESKDAQWNYTVNVTRPVEKVSIQNTIGGGYCVTRTGQFEKGSVSVSGNRSQNCPNDPNFDTDAIALQLAQEYSGGANLEAGDDCNETVVGDQENNTFNKTFTFEQGGGGGNPGINNNQRAAGRGNFK